VLVGARKLCDKIILVGSLKEEPIKSCKTDDKPAISVFTSDRDRRILRSCLLVTKMFHKDFVQNETSVQILPLKINK
jgi:hypothetical protein